MDAPVASCQCTVLFEEPFWVAVFERHDEAGYAVARTVFGAEPSDVEVAQFILRDYFSLRFSQPLPTAAASGLQAHNHKRAQREAKKLAGARGTSTKAQAALQQELERNKKIRREQSKEERDAEKQRKFALHLERQKQKKRGH